MRVILVNRNFPKAPFPYPLTYTHTPSIHFWLTYTTPLYEFFIVPLNLFIGGGGGGLKRQIKKSVESAEL